MSITWPRVLTPTHLSKLIRTQKNPLKALDIFNEAKVKYPNYRHNSLVYSTMIKALGSCGRVAEVKEVLRMMKEDPCQCYGSVFVEAIRSYARAGLLDEGILLFNSLPEFNCVNFTEPFNALLEIMLEESKLELCHRFILENFHRCEIKSRLRSFNVLMDALCGINRSDLALQVFREMSYQWCYPERKSFKILMKGLCKDGNFTEAVDLLNTMISNKSCVADISVYRILLEALYDKGNVDEALELLETVLRRGVKAPKRYFRSLDLHFKQVASVEQAKALINELLVRGSTLSSDSYEAMIVDLYNEGRINESGWLIKEMHKKGFKASSPIYEAKTAALFTSGEVEAAMDVVEREMIENGCLPTLRLHKIVIKGLCDTRHVPRALDHLERMSKPLGCVPDKETYKYIVDGLCCDGKYMEASEIVEKMLRKTLWPEDEMYTKVIHGLCHTQRPHIAAMWLEEMISQAKVPPVSVWSSLVSAVCDNNFTPNKIFMAALTG